jgi:valyl-tRNA synthetase
VRDENGQKMSKTRGNVVDPLEAIEKYGCDAFRFTMTAFAAQGRDVLWDEKRVEANGRFVTKIWQALRYAFMHAEGYDPSAPMDFGPHERWIQVRTGEAVKRVREALDAYKFNEVASEIHSFVWNEFCDWYIELSKSDIYDENGTAARKNAVKHTLFETWRAIARLAHPVMPFLTEEIWSRLPGTEGFVTTQPFPKASDFPADDGVLAEIAALQDCIGEVRRIRGEMRLAGRIALRLLIADPGLLARLRPHAKALDDVAGVALEELVTRPNGVAVAVVQGHEVVIPLEGVIDFSEEVKRLDKELLKIEKDQSDLEKRLGNADFVSRAPPSVLEDFRAKLELARKRQETLSESRKRFAEAL